MHENVLSSSSRQGRHHAWDAFAVWLRERPRELARLSVRRDDLARGARKLPLAIDLDGGPAQRPGRPRRQHPHAQEHRRQVHRTKPLPVGRRGQSAPQSRAGQAAGSQGPRGRSGNDSASLHLRDRDHPGGAGSRAGLGVRRPGPAGGEAELPLRRYALSRRTPRGSVGTGCLGPGREPAGNQALVLFSGGVVHRSGHRSDPLRPGGADERQRPRSRALFAGAQLDPVLRGQARPPAHGAVRCPRSARRLGARGTTAHGFPFVPAADHGGPRPAARSDLEGGVFRRHLRPEQGRPDVQRLEVRAPALPGGDRQLGRQQATGQGEGGRHLGLGL